MMDCEAWLVRVQQISRSIWFKWCLVIYRRGATQNMRRQRQQKEGRGSRKDARQQPTCRLTALTVRSRASKYSTGASRLARKCRGSIPRDSAPETDAKFTCIENGHPIHPS